MKREEIKHAAQQMSAIINEVTDERKCTYQEACIYIAEFLENQNDPTGVEAIAFFRQASEMTAEKAEEIRLRRIARDN